MDFTTNKTANSYEACDEEGLLPCDTFPSHFLYALFLNKVSCILLSLEIFIFAILLLSSKNHTGAIIAVSVCGGLIILLSAIAVCVNWKTFVCLTEANEVMLLREVTAAKPGLDMKKWRSIASKLNPIIFRNSPSATPYFFYDGDACVYYFKRRFLQPYLEKQRQRELRSQQVGTSEENNTTAAYNQLDPFIEEAVIAYEESLNVYWSQMMNESLPV